MYHIWYMTDFAIETEGWLVSGLSISMLVLLLGSKRFIVGLFVSYLNSFRYTEN